MHKQMPQLQRAIGIVFVGLVAYSLVGYRLVATAQDGAANPANLEDPANPAAIARPSDDLARRQERLASKYAQLEDLMLRMAQMEAAQNPRRATLLNQAIASSKESHTKLQLDTIATLLGKRQLSRAAKEQVSAEQSLAELLKLLQSEDRSERLKTEQERIKEYLKEVERMIRIQRSIQGQNEGGGDAKRIAQEQEKLADRAEELSDKIKENEESQAKAEQPPGDQKPGDQKPGDQKPGDQKPGDQKPGDQKPGDQKPGDQPSEQPASPEQKNPVREKIDAAQQRMKAAEQKLKQSERKESVAEQQAAREELEKAKAELEKILRQLREEEKERTLQALEARFRKMLEMQVKVLEGTQKLAAIPSEEQTRELDVQAGRLGGDEAKIALEAEKALQLLQEEGSSVAFPTTVDLLVDDMRSVSGRLNEAKVDSITQSLEEEIIETLQELLLALEQAQQKMEEKKQQNQQQPQQPQGQQEERLVDAIQELKMIKSLQLRVNKRTDRYARLLDDENDAVGQANTKELLEALDQLGERQKQVFEIVREIVLGRNK